MKRKIWKWSVLVFTAVVMLSLCGCGGGGGDDSSSTPGTIELINDSVATIDGFFLARINQTSWGSNILSGPLFSGQNTFIVNIFPGLYDAKIRATGVYSIYAGYAYDIHVASNSIVPLYVYDSSFTGSLEIRNNTAGANIIGVFVVPSTASSWGANQTASTIGPSGLFQLYDMVPGLYDVRIVWDVGPDSIYLDIDIGSLTLTTLNVD